MSAMTKPSDFTVTDLFCGAGGSTQGVLAVGARVRVALNHWERAIETYGRNHGDHVEVIEKTDISACDPRRYPSTQLGVFSPECTTHSPAGGNRRTVRNQSDLFIPMEAIDPATVRSRATMFDVVRFAEFHRYDALIVENVVEATKWELFPDWLRMMYHLGYKHRVVSLNSMFCHPTPQSRDRIYVVFWKKGNRAPDLDIRPEAWCHRCERLVASRQTWKNGRTVGKYRRQYIYTCPKCRIAVEPFYYASLNVIDFTIPAERIGDRPKPLAPRSMERVSWGLKKFGRRVLVVNVKQGERDSSRAWPADTREMGAVPTWDGYFALAHPSPFLVTAGSRPSVAAGDAPAPTQTGTERLAVVDPGFLIEVTQSTRGPLPIPTDSPLRTQTGQQSAALVSPFAPFLAVMRGTDPRQAGSWSRSLSDPIDTASAGGIHHALVHGAALMSMRDAGAMHVTDLSGPTKAQGTAPQAALLSYAPFILSHYGCNNGSGIDSPIPSVTTIDRHELVGHDVPEPAVEDCYFRMLQPHEIGRAMAFPDEYEVTGNKRDRVKQYGNAVTPPAMSVLMRRVIGSLEGGIAA